jgi:putative NADPH-quinone reductase
MSKRIAVIQGYPDPNPVHFGHAMADAYAQGAGTAGHEVKRVDVAQLHFPLLKTKEEWSLGEPPPGLHDARAAIRWADHLLVVFPLWLGDMPANLKGFFEQVLRPGFAFAAGESGPFSKKLLSGKSARLIVTMGMPAAVYRWYFRAHSVKSLERNILGFCCIAPIDETLIGMVETPDNAVREKWLMKIRMLGARAR